MAKRKARKSKSKYNQYRKNLMARIRYREKKGWTYTGAQIPTEAQLRKQGANMASETRKIKKMLADFDKLEFATQWGEIVTVKEAKQRRMNPIALEVPSIIETIKDRIGQLSGTKLVNLKGKGNRGKYIDLEAWGNALLRLVEYAEETSENNKALIEHYERHESEIFNALDRIIFDSDQQSVYASYTQVLAILKNAPVSLEEAKHMDEIAEEAWEYD